MMQPKNTKKTYIDHLNCKGERHFFRSIDHLRLTYICKHTYVASTSIVTQLDAVNAKIVIERYQSRIFFPSAHPLPRHVITWDVKFGGWFRKFHFDLGIDVLILFEFPHHGKVLSATSPYGQAKMMGTQPRLGSALLFDLCKNRTSLRFDEAHLLHLQIRAGAA